MSVLILMLLGPMHICIATVRPESSFRPMERTLLLRRSSMPRAGAISGDYPDCVM